MLPTPETNRSDVPESNVCLLKLWRPDACAEHTGTSFKAREERRPVIQRPPVVGVIGIPWQICVRGADMSSAHSS